MPLTALIATVDAMLMLSRHAAHFADALIVHGRRHDDAAPPARHVTLMALFNIVTLRC